MPDPFTEPTGTVASTGYLEYQAQAQDETSDERVWTPFGDVTSSHKQALQDMASAQIQRQKENAPKLLWRIAERRVGAWTASGLRQA